MTQVFVLLITLISMFPAKENNSTSIKAMTFNIRYGTANDGDNSWKYRRNLVFSVIDNSKCDFIGMQEAMVFQIEEIIQSCPTYKYIGVTRNVDPAEGEASPILYNATKWELIDGQTLWLSETPDKPGSKSWNSSFPRIFTWGKFKNKESSLEILIINTHYDHKSAEARSNSSRVIVKYISDNIKGMNAILLGDFNAPEDEDPIIYLTTNQVHPLVDVYRTIHADPSDDDVTFYGWKEPKPGTGKRLDYIFFSGYLTPLSSEVVKFNINGRYPSDHLPVIAEFK